MGIISRLPPKYMALIALIIQNSGLAISMRYTMIFSSPSTRYLTSTAVLVAEMLKFIISCVCCYLFDSNQEINKFTKLLYDECVHNKVDFIKLTIPSILYTVQNTLQYYSISLLSAPVFQVLSQLKILTTAIFSVILLSRKLSVIQWTSIVFLSGGVSLVQLSQLNDSVGSNSTVGFNSQTLGLISVLCGCMTSGFAGVYFEMVLKSSQASIWLRNIQLSLIGISIASISCYTRDYEVINSRGFFSGYNHYVWLVIILQAAGGLIVAIVVKYADNVLKGFATSISIVLSCMTSAYLFHDVSLNIAFSVGALIVLLAVYFFGYTPSTPNSSKNDTRV